MTLICKCYAAECTKTGTKILHVQKSEKRENALGKAPKSKTRCVLGAGMVENRSELVVADGNTCEKAITFGTDLSRLPARVLLPGGECPELTNAAAENGAVACVPPARTCPTTRTARGADAPRCQDIPPANEKKSGTAAAIPDFFGRGRRT